MTFEAKLKEGFQLQFCLLEHSLCMLPLRMVSLGNQLHDLRILSHMERPCVGPTAPAEPDIKSTDIYYLSKKDSK